MIMAGRNIKQYNDPLQKVQLAQLYHGLIHPKPSVMELIQKLRIVHTINTQQYRKLKTTLPYVTCGIFNPRIRKTENFGSLTYFILDIDHLHEKGLKLEALRQKISSDPRVSLLFASPSNDGLKVFFKLKNKCFDAQKYSIFYKAFAREFSLKYQLEQVLDSRTSDVTRACFVSHDPQTYYNSEPELIDIQSFVNFNNLLEIKELEKKTKADLKKGDILPQGDELTDDLLEEIKRKLNPNIRLRPKKPVFVPKVLDKITETVTKTVNEYDIMVKEIKNIQYGKQITFAIDELHWAEINIFYGKKGFSVVKSAKSGSNAELATILHTLLNDLFYNLPTNFLSHE